MKNVTVAIDEKTLNAGRQYARTHGTSLNALLRRLLEQTVVPGKNSASWADEFFALADKAKGNSKSRRWRREDLYDA